MLKLVMFVPVGSEDAVKDAVFAAGAGRLGAYSECAWQTLGTGQFRPSLAANPTLGTRGAVSQIAEWRIEVLVSEAVRADVVQALRRAHPYEEPAFEFIRLEWPAD